MNRIVTNRRQTGRALRALTFGFLVAATGCKKGPDFEPPPPVAPESSPTINSASALQSTRQTQVHVRGYA